MNRTSWRIIKNSEEHAAAMERLIELASSDLQLELKILMSLNY